MGLFSRLRRKGSVAKSSTGLLSPEPDVAPKKLNIKIARLQTKYFADGSTASVSVASTYGLIRFTVHDAELSSAKDKEKYFCVVSVGSQSLISKNASSRGAAGAITWDASSNLILQRGGASIARVAVYRSGRLDGALHNTLQCWATVDLSSAFPPEGEGSQHPRDASADGSAHGSTAGSEQIEAGASAAEGSGASLAPAAGLPAGTGHWVDLVDPAEPTNVRGRVRVSGAATSMEGLEAQLWRRLLPLADFDGTGALEESEFVALLKALGSDLTETEMQDLFAKADLDHDGSVDGDELAGLLAGSHARGELHRLLTRCPVDGAQLPAGQDLSNMLYILLCLDEMGHDAQLKGGYLTSQQASRAWVYRMSEWVTQPLAGHLPGRGKYTAGGPRVGGAAAHTLVYDRASRLVVEERVNPAVVLAMRNMYQSPLGRVSQREGAYKILTRLSEREGKYADSAASAKEILPFLETYRQDIVRSEFLDPVESYKTFNQFFYRKLKPEARLVAAPGNPGVVVSAADCRLMVYDNVSDATRCWIKGKAFSLAGLLAEPDGGGRPLGASLAGGSLAIFRLAPQDYHRFHAPVAGVVRSMRDVPGMLLTVNPIAVNSKFADVFTVNKRSVMVIKTQEYGDVAFVAIGATVVGSINWTVKPGDVLAKGDELGFFAFGGSTNILVMRKGAVAWDADLLANGLKSLETLVRVGERIGGAPDAAPEPAAAADAAAAAAAATEGIVPLDERPEAAAGESAALADSEAEGVESLALG